MKRLIFLFIVLLVCLFTSSVWAQAHIYIKITDANNTTLTTGLSSGGQVTDGSGKIDLTDYAEVTSLQFDQEQDVAIGSSPGGSATGKIKFNPLIITKEVNAASSKLMITQAKGTSVKTVEIVFVSSTGGSPSTGVSHKIVLKNAAVKSYSASFSTDAEAPTESVSFDYGILQVFTYTQNPDTKQYVLNPFNYGWNRINNVSAQ